MYVFVINDNVCVFLCCQNIEWKEGSFFNKRKISSKQEYSLKQVYLRKLC